MRNPPTTKRPPSARTELLEQTVDVRAFARQYVQVILQNEGITLTPPRFAEAS